MLKPAASESESEHVLPRILFILTGVTLLAAAVAVANSVRSFSRDAKRADGVVARLNAGGSHPQIDFTTASGQKVSYPQGGLIFGYRAGQQVRVLYSPAAPEQSARLDSFGALWATPIILGIVALFLLATGASMKSAARPLATEPGAAQREGK